MIPKWIPLVYVPFIILFIISALITGETIFWVDAILFLSIFLFLIIMEYEFEIKLLRLKYDTMLQYAEGKRKTIKYW